MAVYEFNSTFVKGRALPFFDDSIVKNEPMLFSCDVAFAREHGGPITRAFFDAIGDDLEYPCVFDSRVHMLMPGWYPCIPGWHHDDIPRSRADGQPNYDDPEYHALHALALVNGDVAPTEFAVGKIALPKVEASDPPVYGVWNDMVTSAVSDGRLRSEFLESNRIHHFDSHAFHRGTACVKGGWRWFGRLSWRTNRPIHNEIRRQVQVYLSTVEQGW